jgi:pimeloyl-ACP methyl ester carboxylesterase
VVLVHGFLATPALMRAIRWRLERAGHRVYSPELSLLAIQDVRRLASQLDLAIDRVRHACRVDRVHLVGTSQGGIIALWWAHHLCGWERTDRMVSIGAPFRGTWAALAGLPALGLVSRGIWQLLPGSPLLDELDRPLPEGARFTTVALSRDPVAPAERCTVPGATHRVFDAPFGPLNHQWITFSDPINRAVIEALAP